MWRESTGKYALSNGHKEYPHLRFHAEDGTNYPDLESYSMGDLYTERKEAGEEGLPILSVSIHTGVSDGELDESETTKRVKRIDDKSLYRKADTGDLVFNMMRAWQGALGVVKTAGMVSPAYIVAKPNDKIYPPYVDYYVKTDNMVNQIHRLSYGVTDFRLRLYWTSFQAVKCRLPVKQEQKRIADFLKKLDERIEKQRELVENLKKYKRGLSDKLFGENGITEEWTTVPFSEAFELLQNNTFSRDEMTTKSGIVHNIHYGDILIKYDAVINLSKSNVPYIRSDVGLSKFSKHSYLRDGDIVIADTAEDYTVGKSVEMAEIAEEKVLSGLHTIPCRPKLSFAPMYLGYFINSKMFRTQMLPLIQGTKVSSISKSEILKTAVIFPSYEMQSRIASMLFALDQKIDICNACARELVRIKEALLQQLFI